MADNERPQGGADKSQRRWLIGGLAAGGLALVYVWWKNRGASSSGSSTDSSSGSSTDSAGGSASPTDMRDVLQINTAAAPDEKEDNQPTTSHTPKPKPKPKPKRHVPPRKAA